MTRRDHILCRSLRAVSLLAAAALADLTAASSQTLLPDSFFAGRPAFSPPEQPARPASCEDIAAQRPDSVARDSRVDMAIAGHVTLIQTDSALWSVAVCADSGVRVLCVAYDANGLKLGDNAVLRGGYSRQGRRHMLLDPCLASAPSRASGGGTGLREEIVFHRSALTDTRA